MDRFLVVFSLINFVFFPPICDGSEVKKYNETQGEVLRETLQQILKFDLPLGGKDLSQDAGRDGDLDGGASGKLKPEKTKIALKLPLHMIELYEKYTFENIASGETIRSIEPSTDFVPHFKDILVFNVSSVQDVRSDKLRTAHFHMHRRGGAGLAMRKSPDGKFSRGRALPPPCRVRLYQIIGGSTGPSQPEVHPAVSDGAKELRDIEKMKLRNLDSIPVPQVTRGGWYSIEISMALKEMLNSPAAASSFVFGVRFEGPRGKSISPQHFLKEPGNNSSSTFIVTFSDDSLDTSSKEKERVKLSRNQIDIMNELLEEAALSAIKMEEKKNSKDAPTNNDPSSYLKEMPSFESHDKSRHMKRKLKKMESAFSEINPKEQIRHGKKFRNRHLQDTDSKSDDPDYIEDNFDSRKSSDKSDDRHSKVTSVPGNGDISELLDYDRVKKVRAMRRHNHKRINSLNLRYDTATKSVIQKKIGMWEDADLSQDINESQPSEARIAGQKSYTSFSEKHRFARSAHDTENTDYVLEFASPNDNKGGEETSTDVELNEEDNSEKVYFKNDQNKIVSKTEGKQKEYAKEDDMGDLSYYEPDVYMHENLIPSSHRQHSSNSHLQDSYEYANDNNKNLKYEDDIETNEVLKKDDEFYKNNKASNRDEKHGKKSKHKANKNKSKSVDDAGNSKKNYSQVTKEDDEKLSSIGADDAVFSSGSEKRRHKNQKRKSRKGSKKNALRKKTLSPDFKSWEQSNETDESSACRRSELLVRFADIGWGDWIIAPEVFQAGFCSGRCDIYNSEKVNITNHAIVQTLIRNIGHESVPKPCCVPSKYAPLTVLYLDESNRVVLKNYQDMQVLGCVCK